MKVFEGFPVLGKEKEAEKREENLFQERADFLKENYPLEESHYDLEDLLCNSLDGKEVIERRDDNGEIEAFMTYDIEEDDEKNPYCSLGVILTREESRGEGVMNELFGEIREIARERDCEYVVGIADTPEGEEFFLSKGFVEDFDRVNNRNYFRLDL